MESIKDVKMLYLIYFEDVKSGLFRSTFARIDVARGLGVEAVILRVMYKDSLFLKFLKLLFRVPSTPESEPQDEGDSRGSVFFIRKGILLAAYYRWPTLFRGVVNKLVWSKAQKQLVKMASKNSKFHGVTGVHCHWVVPTVYLGSSLSKVLSVPVYVTFHGSEINDAKWRSLLRAEIDAGVVHIDHAFCVSGRLLELARIYFPNLSSSESLNSYSAKDLSHYVGLRIPRVSRSIDVIFVGNLYLVKGVDRLGRLFSAVSSKFRSRPVKYAIVGDGYYRERIEREMVELGLDVEFMGRLGADGTALTMRQARVLCLPSRDEGLPMVLIEAACLDVFAIASDVGGCSEILDKKQLVAMGDDFIKEFSDKVVGALTTFDLGKEISPPNFDLEDSILHEIELYTGGN